MSPKLSFVVPSHNREEWVAECIESLLGQDEPDIEIIVVNDGSEDGTKAFLDREYGHRARIKIHHNEKSIGAGMSRNKGIELAEAPIIAVCDDDDIYPSCRARLTLEAFKVHPEGVMINFPYIRVGYEQELIQQFPGEPFNEEEFKKTGMVNYFCHPSCAYTKKDILEIGGYRAETKGETDDFKLVQDWIKAGKKIGFANPDFLCGHRVLPTSVMAKMRGFEAGWTEK